MSDSERPKPQYGEYASDDEQASALARSGSKPTSAHESGPHPNATAHPRAAHPRAAHPQTAAAPLTAQRPRSAFDRIVTIFLLSFGAVSILGSAATFMNLGEILPEIVANQGMGVFHPTEQTTTIGVVIFATQVLVWVIAAVWSFRRIKRQKLAWWVPVLLGVLGFIVLSMLLGAALSADPSFIPSLSKP